MATKDWKECTELLSEAQQLLFHGMKPKRGEAARSTPLPKGPNLRLRKKVTTPPTSSLQQAAREIPQGRLPQGGGSAHTIITTTELLMFDHNRRVRDWAKASTRLKAIVRNQRVSLIDKMTASSFVATLYAEAARRCTYSAREARAPERTHDYKELPPAERKKADGAANVFAAAAKWFTNEAKESAALGEEALADVLETVEEWSESKAPMNQPIVDALLELEEAHKAGWVTAAELRDSQQAVQRKVEALTAPKPPVGKIRGNKGLQNQILWQAAEHMLSLRDDEGASAEEGAASPYMRLERNNVVGTAEDMSQLAVVLGGMLDNIKDGYWVKNPNRKSEAQYDLIIKRQRKSVFAIIDKIEALSRKLRKKK